MPKEGMTRLQIKTPAKVNLCLDITAKRADGYHELSMIMQEIPLYDEITIEKADKITVSCNLKYIPCNESNLAYKAAAAFFEHTGISGGADIYLHKNIPSGAGLGGGSSNAAGVITALNEIYQAGLTPSRRMEIGEKIGADVPYFVLGGACHAQGIGEKLTQILPLKSCWMVLVKPPFSVSTKWAYQNFNLNDVKKRPDINAIKSAMRRNDIYTVGRNMINVLENAVIPQFLPIAKNKKTMLSFGAVSSVMTGSGSAAFGLFDDERKADKCFEAVKNNTEKAWVLRL